MIVYGDMNEAAAAWEEFQQVCHEISKREFDLRHKEAWIEPPSDPGEAEWIFDGSLVEQILVEKETVVRNFTQQIARAEKEMAELMEKKRKENARPILNRLAELAGQSSRNEFDDKIRDAQLRAGNAWGERSGNGFERFER